MVRYYGSYSHRYRGRARRLKALEGEGPAAGEAPRATPAEPGSPTARRRSSWARLLKKVFEVDPLLCPRCRVEMKVVAWITDTEAIDTILSHRRRAGLESPFDARAPPAA